MHTERETWWTLQLMLLEGDVGNFQQAARQLLVDRCGCLAGRVVAHWHSKLADLAVVQCCAV